jgi:hypothetical protein
MRAKTIGRLAAAGLGAALLTGVAGAAMAEDEVGSEGIDLSVQIAPLAVPGALTMSVAGDSVTLAEDGSTDVVRQFKGELPEVTVTDTRDPAAIDPAAAWYVVGSVSEFTGDASQDPITAGHLGWSPRLVSADPGSVSEGDPVDTVMDSGADAVGLVDQELFMMARNSSGIAAEGSWTAAADLFLRTPADVAPGAYTARLTLSLFE